MALVTALTVGVLGLINEGPGTGFGVFAIYLLFGLFFAAFIGPFGGGLLGLVLAAMKWVNRAPVVGAVTPPAVIIPITLVLAAPNDGPNVLPVIGLAVGAAVAYAPLGFLAGKFYVRMMTR